MSIKCGIVGLPNVGKSTLFNALTKATIAAENYPFCTIDPNIGIVPVPDNRLAKLAAIVNPKQIIPAIIEFVDIAGLVKGASQGEGLGNQFLAAIRETQAIAHVVRCFENVDVVHVSGRVNPIDDIEIINTELALADLNSVERALNRSAKVAKGGDKEAKADLAALEQIKAHLDKGEMVRTMQWETPPEILKQLFLLTNKQVLYVANVDEKGFTNNSLLAQVEERAKSENSVVVPICATIEAEIAQLPDEEKPLFLEEMGLKEPGLNRLIKAAYELLNLQTYFTAGPKEVRAWTVKKGARAPEAAGVIHTDFEKGFIRAEVVAYDDYVKYKGEHGAREAGKLRLEGKNYIVQDGDIMHFRFNV